MTITRTTKIVPAVLALVLVAAACGDDDADTTTSAATATTAAAGATTRAAGDANSAGGSGGPSDYLGSYTLIDDQYGTMVTVTVDGATRTIESNSLPDHDTGEFPNDGNPNTITEQSLTYEFTTQPTFTGGATFAQAPGVAVNGVAMEPGTAESVTCASGETYRIEALQAVYNLGLDFNNAHVQPGGQYHYHGVSQMLVDAYAADGDLVHVGFAADGFLMYYSKSGAFAPGYQLATEARGGTDCVPTGPNATTFDLAGTAPDGTYVSDWVFVEGLGDLDSCNGVEIEGQYAYVLTDGYPYISRCLNGEFTATGPGGAPPGGAPPPGGADAGQPDLSEAAATLGITERELLDALGPPPPDLTAAAERLGISVEDLLAVLPPPGGQG